MHLLYWWRWPTVDARYDRLRPVIELVLSRCWCRGWRGRWRRCWRTRRGSSLGPGWSRCLWLCWCSHPSLGWWVCCGLGLGRRCGFGWLWCQRWLLLAKQCEDGAHHIRRSHEFRHALLRGRGGRPLGLLTTSALLLGSTRWRHVRCERRPASTPCDDSLGSLPARSLLYAIVYGIYISIPGCWYQV